MKRELKSLIKNCEIEINKIKVQIAADPFSLMTPFLTKYALIKACGTTEAVYKSIIANYFDRSKLPQVHKYITENVRESSSNPKYGNIAQMLSKYDDIWSNNFRSQINSHPSGGRIISSLNSLASARNSFAHGGNPTITIRDIDTYFQDCKIMLNIIDNIIR